MKVTDNYIGKLKAIVNGAPEGATHYGIDGQYWKVISVCDTEEYYCYTNGVNTWTEEEYFYGNQLLSDLQGIIALREEVDRLVEDKLEITRACANVGVDFGYGKYELEEHIIDKARKIYESMDE